MVLPHVLPNQLLLGNVVGLIGHDRTTVVIPDEQVVVPLQIRQAQTRIETHIGGSTAILSGQQAQANSAITDLAAL